MCNIFICGHRLSNNCLTPHSVTVVTCINSPSLFDFVASCITIQFSYISESAIFHIFFSYNISSPLRLIFFLSFFFFFASPEI